MIQIYKLLLIALGLQRIYAKLRNINKIEPGLLANYYENILNYNKLR